MKSLLASDFDRQGLVIEAIAVAGPTGQFIHVSLHDCPCVITIGFTIAAINVGNQALEWNVNISDSTELIFIMEMEFFPVRTVENQVLLLFRQFLKRLVHVHTKVIHGLLQHLRIVVG